MRQTQVAIDSFLQQILYTPTADIEEVRNQRQSQGYLCPSAKDLAVHLILELFDSASTPEANINRIASNLELAAAQLEYLSRCIKSIPRT